MDKLFEQFYEKNETEIFRDIADIIAIPSIARASEQGEQEAPYGQEVKKGLEFLLKKGKALGLETKNYDFHVGEIIAGTGENIVGLLCHVDVVDAGDGWITDPFKAEVIDGELYGRGAIDDKGPMICALYAMKYLTQNHYIPENGKIKMIIGTDEEENWNSIQYYLEQNPELPTFSIVPDANFPVVYCEKGLINLELTLSVGNEKKETASPCFKMISLKGGERGNVVPANASCEITFSTKDYAFEKETVFIDEFAKKHDIRATTSVNNGRLCINVFGKAAHAMTPEKGKNAISWLMKLLKTMSKETDIRFEWQNFIDFYDRYIGLQYDGENLGMKWEDHDSGPLTLNVGVLALEENVVRIKLNLRYPVSRSFAEIRERFDQLAADASVKVEYGVCMEPIFYPKDSRLVQSLMKVYQQFTGDKVSQPIALGGATYARAIPKAIAFGPVFPNQEELAHEANEHYTFSDYKKITEIYANAILQLFNIL